MVLHLVKLQLVLIQFGNIVHFPTVKMTTDPFFFFFFNYRGVDFADRLVFII